jgi:hypothetical protein
MCTHEKADAAYVFVMLIVHHDKRKDAAPASKPLLDCVAAQLETRV